MRAIQFIPEKYKLVVYRTRNNADAPVGHPRPFSTTPEVQKDIKRVIGVIGGTEYENIPTSGFHIMVDDYSELQIFHPDGYALNLTKYNIGIIIRECNINQGTILDDLIFVFDKSYKEHALIPFGKDSYNEVKLQSDDFFAAKTNTSELKYGSLLDYNGTKFVYSGKYWFNSIGEQGIKTVERYILRDIDTDNRYYAVSTARKPDAILDNTSVNVIDEQTFISNLSNLKEIKEITTFYKSGSFNWKSLATSTLLFSTEKIKKTEFDITYTTDVEYGTSNFPLFVDNDNKLYAVVHYKSRLAYNVGHYDIGAIVECIPYDISTLYASGEKDSSGNFKHVCKRKIVKIAAPKLEKK